MRKQLFAAVLAAVSAFCFAQELMLNCEQPNQVRSVLNEFKDQAVYEQGKGRSGNAFRIFCPKALQGKKFHPGNGRFQSYTRLKLSTARKPVRMQVYLKGKGKGVFGVLAYNRALNNIYPPGTVRPFELDSPDKWTLLEYTLIPENGGLFATSVSELLPYIQLRPGSDFLLDDWKISVLTVQFDPVFSSRMVLQQERPISFFGTADPGAALKVVFNGRTVNASADAKGAWKADFPAMKAGSTPYVATVNDGKSQAELHDVLIGEVWFCSGQSNMQMPIGKTFRRGWSALNCEKEVAAANYPEIRYAFQRLVYSPQKPLPALYAPGFPYGWEICSPSVAHLFSATAYFFGRKLYQDLKVPIGLINASWGGRGSSRGSPMPGMRHSDRPPIWLWSRNSVWMPPD